MSHGPVWILLLSLHVLLSTLSCSPQVQASTSLLDYSLQLQFRGGGASSKRKRSSNTAAGDPFESVARAIQDRLTSELLQDDPSTTPPTVSDVMEALEFLSSSQQTFKGLDGAAHEAYQRTHAGNAEDIDLSVRGRARRSAARAAATADGLEACELCELMELGTASAVDGDSISVNGTLEGRTVLLNLTASDSTVQLDDGTKVSVIVLYESMYNGGAGILHGGIAEEEDSSPKTARKNKNKIPKGRLIIIVGDDLRNDLMRSLKVLDKPPKHIRLNSGLVSGEIASVQPTLYKAAASLLQVLEPTLRKYENGTAAIHFVGRSLAGGVANLAALILDGSLPMSKNKKGKKAARKKTKAQSTSEQSEGTEDDTAHDSNMALLSSTDHSSSSNNNNNTTTQVRPLAGFGKDRTSAVSLGAPPTLSSNVQSDFIISIMYGDDTICRASRASFDRLLKRSKKALKSKSWLGGRQLNFMSDALSMTTSSLKSHAHGSEGEELRLSVPGRAYLLRPRRLGGTCSIHEVGIKLKGGREALRAHLLWQLDDILLSKSLWRHHQLDSYIHGLDRAHLRGFTDDGSRDEG